MKHVSQKATRILNTLTDGLDQDNRSRTFNAHDYDLERGGGIMSVHVEFIKDCGDANIQRWCDGRSPVFSVAHYYKQNGDLCRDPEMTFMKIATVAKRKGKHTIVETYCPLTVQTSTPPTYQRAVVYHDNGGIKGFRPAMMSGLARFANAWMNNIKRQQNL